MAKVPKSLSERIAERVRQQKTNKRSKHLADFLANRDDIKQALADKWPVKTIWETLREEGKITCSYQSFILDVKKLIVDSSKKAETLSPTDEGRAQTEKIEPPKEKEGIKNFVFNAVPNEKELL